jgi:membrane protease YdiL (CAAX protease family)
MRTSSRRTWTIVGVGALAFALTAIIGGIWTGLLAVNLTTSPAIPWSVVVMGALLFALYRYLGGAGPPHRTSATRRVWLRANRVAPPAFGWALTAGLLGIVALAGLWFTLLQLAGLPARTLLDVSHYPAAVVALVLLMASLVNGVTEEALFRGYFQGLLEGQVGGLSAIVITMLVMSPEHSLTQGFVWPTIVFYLLVDLMLGMLARLTRSILPGMVVHCVGLLVFFTLVWQGDAARTIFGQGTTTQWLWIHSGQAIFFAALSVAAFLRLAQVMHKEPTPALRPAASA